MLLVVMAAALTTGCDEDENGRVAELAREAAQRQAEQNKEMAKVNQTVAEATERLVAADAEARKEIVIVHREIQSERSGLNAQHDRLEEERKDIAQQRLTESWIGPVIQSSGILVVAGLAICFCILLILGLRKSNAADAELNELLVQELVSEHPVILPLSPARPAIDNKHKDESTASALPSPDN